ncbi:dihydrolipoamide acetyltransferase family protein [Spirosoma utsteinense]|uniref:Dihydrolipoamide acetyltransferase component of pyruvate dehydrogenase complex n=1 Tax=Spirosoma utsteinense TaxID=2585773 RepID=A0ABR6WDX9_9BACT|nr:dihydrolipoamide acetyltransferase family protein [Spirosoma utsteinense]MBC3788786.1 2-oxoglutarate dehydrogenase E2 component (dihydrolipoamide succinyltransferase) [Spirosoma utsteinense]MBC3794739.1 2-oxoglutarate dehydrogenase E2 component (dihydrolipoamide succinyltransferase) [Spirosoma utsteinense]
MALIDMVMPKMGESIMECTVIGWLKQPGDRVEADESVLEVATDKVDTEVPAPYNGILKEILVKDGDVVAVGAPIARLETEEAVSGDTQSAPAPPAPATVPDSTPVNADQTPMGIGDVANVPAETEPESIDELAEVKAAQELEASISTLSSRSAPMADKAVAASPTQLAESPATFSDRFYSPLVLNIAREEGISRDELDRIIGSGADNRVTKKDMLAYVIDRAEGRVAPVAAVQIPPSTPPPSGATPRVSPPKSEPPVNGSASGSINGQSDIIQMDRMRKMIAQRMVESKQISPHVSSFVEADMTPVVQWRARIKDQFKQQTGENLTYTPILIEAIARAIKDFPMINVSVDGDTILVKKQVNVGMAVALPSGNLIVPVIHNADQYNLVGLTKKVNDLTKRARENKLTADDLAGGTYTISNIGTFGNLMGTPIILQPQVAIMAFGAIVKKPAVIETADGDFIGIRQLMFLSHSYDHRVVDGSLGGQFVRRVADYLEKFDITRSL